MRSQTRIRLPLCVILASAALLSGLGTISAQEKKTAKPQPASRAKEPAASIVVGTVASERGTTGAIPIYYEPGKTTPLKKVHLDLDFVSNSVKFDKAEKGVAAQVQDYDLKVTAQELPPDDKKILHTRLSVDVAVTDPSKSLPQGLLAFLNFKVPEDAKPFSIAINPVTTSAEDVSSKPAEIAAEAGKLIVSIPDAPLAGCFFFSH